MFYTAIVDNTSMTMENRDKIHMKDVFLKKTFIQEEKSISYKSVVECMTSMECLTIYIEI